MIISSSNYRDEELNIPKQMFEAAGAKVDVASEKHGKARGMLGSRIESDLLYSEAKVDDYDAVIFVGGVGCKIFWNDARAHSIAKETVEKDKLLGAICLAPATLANAGILKGKKATSYSMASPALKKAGATYTGKPVEVDNNIVTGEGPAAAEEFARTIIRELSKQNTIRA